MTYYGNKRKRIIGLWLLIKKALDEGASVEEVRWRYRNPKNGKPYCAKHIWWIAKQLEKEDQ